MTRVAVVSAGLREPSSTKLLADRLAQATTRALQDKGEVAQVDHVVLRDLARGIADAMTVGFGGPRLDEAFATIRDADAVIAVSPAFNASFSGLFKSFFDVLPEDALDDMPVLIAATGGTERHSLVLEHAMRPMFSYLHAIISPIAVYAATDDFGTDGAAGGGLGARIDRAATQFVRLIDGCGARQRRDEQQEDFDAMTALLTRGMPG